MPGFDVCHFNLHKTFGTPHGCGGPGAGANAVSAALAPFLPGPRVRARGRALRGARRGEQSIGAVAPFFGVIPNIVRAYAWMMALGADGLRAVAEIAVLNNNYLMKKVLEIPGASAPTQLAGVASSRCGTRGRSSSRRPASRPRRSACARRDFGMHYWTSHHPYVVPQPFTLEPTESYSMAELDEYAAVLAEIAARRGRTPRPCARRRTGRRVHHTHHDDLDDPERWAITWRAYQRKYFGEAAA